MTSPVTSAVIRCEKTQNLDKMFRRGKKSVAHKRPTQDSVRSDWVRLKENCGTQAVLSGVDSTKVDITALRSATIFQRTIHPIRSYSR